MRRRGSVQLGRLRGRVASEHAIDEIVQPVKQADKQVRRAFRRKRWGSQAHCLAAQQEGGLRRRYAQSWQWLHHSRRSGDSLHHSQVVRATHIPPHHVAITVVAVRVRPRDDYRMRLAHYSALNDSNPFQASHALPLYICYILPVSVMPSLPSSPILMYCLDRVIHSI